MVLKRFVARNVRPISPFSWSLDLAGDLLVKMDSPQPLPNAPEVLGDEALPDGGGAESAVPVEDGSTAREVAGC